ncbi:MAG TPA: adenylate/guanylate cyclase domain-containing protein [Stellaceae bacterium]|nr:adenylate/guanylate cyclase domain-containing protein [Stellaceae bacterium]
MTPLNLSNGVREILLAVATALVTLALLSLGGSGWLRGLETASLDLRFRIRGALPPGHEIALVMVDDKSIDALGHWPLSHRLFAQALERLDRAGAKLTVFDLLFAQPEHPLPPDLQAAVRTAVALLPANRDAALRAALKRLADDDPDGDLTGAIRTSGNVFLPIAFDFTGNPAKEPRFLANAGYQRFVKSPVTPVFPLKPVSVITPLPQWAEAAAGLGHVNIAFDRDGAPRYDYLALPFAGDFFPSMPVRVAAAYLGIKWRDVGLALGRSVQLGRLTVPTDEAMRLLVNYRGPRGAFPTYSFVDLLHGKVPAGAFKGRIVLIGASFIGLPDSNASPFGSTPLPGTERMANIIDTILRHSFITEMSEAGWPIAIAIGAVVAALAGLSGLGAAVLPTRLAALAAVLPLAVWAGASQLAFEHGLWLPLVKPMAALAITSIVVLLFRYHVVDHERRVIKAAFPRYLAPEMVDVLARHPGVLHLGGETRTMTMLFCDIRGFTTITEEYKANPHELIHMINRFLTPMTEIVMARRGTIDKYIGDCVMAFWNAPLDNPDHAADACESALEMLAAIKRINAELAAEGQGQGPGFAPLEIGIGINTGDCVVGNIGSDQRFDYSVLGSAVNLAAQLETQSKIYDVGIVIGEATRQLAPELAAVELDRVMVYGRAGVARIYTLLGGAAVARSPEFRALIERHEAMLGRYRAQDWAGAQAALAACLPCDPRLERVYALYAERIAYCTANPPGPGWNGVFLAPAT